MLVQILGISGLVAPCVIALASMVWLRGAVRILPLLGCVFVGWILLYQSAYVTESAASGQPGGPSCGMLSGLMFLFGPVISGGSTAAGAITGFAVNFIVSRVTRVPARLDNV